MTFLGTNSAGLLNKIKSFKRNIQLFKPGAVFIQESKTKRKNKIKLDDYVIFEKIRKKSGGGGLLTAVHKNLEPVSVSSDENEDDEILVVEAKLQTQKIRLVNAYGPQEDEVEDLKKSFYNKLDEVVKSAKIAGAFICIEMDANSKLGPNIIPGDPHPQSKNGKMLESFLNENDLIVVNGLDLCEGKITRFRKTTKRTERSIIDFFIVCRRLLSFVTKMTIDEKRIYTLTKFGSKRGQKIIRASDHNLLILQLKLKWSSLNKAQRIEILNFRNEEDFQKFKKCTEVNAELLECFENAPDFNSACNKWLKVFNKILRNCFRKIRITKSKNPQELDQLFAKKESIQQKLDQQEPVFDMNMQMKLENELEDVLENISSFCAQHNKETIEEYLKESGEAENEPHNQLKTWKLRKKIAPKNIQDGPSAKLNKKGDLITEKSELERLYLETYLDRLTPNPVFEELKDIVELKDLLFDLRMNMCSQVKSRDWDMSDLDKVLKGVKNNKARDAHGHIFELFKLGGHDLKLSLIKMFNLTKKTQIYPDIFQPSNISSIYKSRGRKDDLSNDRGVFNVVKLRSLIDRLSYNDNYDIIDQSMSSSNIGARKNRNIRDHLFVINGILNDVNSQKKMKVDIQIVDIKKCFDKMSYKETANDLYESGIQDDNFYMMALANEKCMVAVKTKRVQMNQIEMQGTLPAPIKCSVQLDTLGKECLETGEGLYKYNECLNIPPLLMIDDAIAVTECGPESVKVNAIIQSKVDMKNLRLGHNKCFKMHVG